MTDKIYDIAVVGAGAAGSMGALRAVLNNLSTVCFTGSAKDKKKARATWVGKIENMPVLFDSPKAVFQSAKEVFDWIQHQELWKDNLNLVKEGVTHIEGSAKQFVLKTEKGNTFRAKYILLCTGIMDVQPLIQNDIKPVFPFANQGQIEYCIRCDGHKTKNKDTVIIGHNESAGWIACLLKERYDCPSLTVLTNGKEFEGSGNKELLSRMNAYEIKIATSPIQDILGEVKMKGLTGFLLEDGTNIASQIAFVSLGTIVYNELAKLLGCNIDDRGYVLTDENGQTNIKGVFIGGDLRANKKKQIYTAWDITVDAVDKIDTYIRAEKREQWLNSQSDQEGLLGSRM